MDAFVRINLQNPSFSTHAFSRLLLHPIRIIAVLFFIIFIGTKVSQPPTSDICKHHVHTANKYSFFFSPFSGHLRHLLVLGELTPPLVTSTLLLH